MGSWCKAGRSQGADQFCIDPCKCTGYLYVETNGASLGSGHASSFILPEDIIVVVVVVIVVVVVVVAVVVFECSYTQN